MNVFRLRSSATDSGKGELVMARRLRNNSWAEKDTLSAEFSLRA
jgi:hypothetical protein